MIPAVAQPHIPAMADDAIAKVRALEVELLALPQVPLRTTHHLHAGMYARTLYVPAGVVATGVLIKCPTLLTFSGHATLFIGAEARELCGYQVIPASAGRKQAILAHTDCAVTMVFPTSARTVAEAEAEFTDECDMLATRRYDFAQESTYITEN